MNISLRLQSLIGWRLRTRPSGTGGFAAPKARCFPSAFRASGWLLSVAMALLFALVPGQTASAAPGVVLGASSSAELNSGSSASQTLSFTVPAGSNRLLVVTSSGAGNNVDIQSVTWNGSNMTQAAKLAQGGGTNSNAGIWYVLMGSSASSTTANVVVTYQNNFFFIMTATTFTGVDQVIPVSGATTGTSLSLSVSSATGNMVIDAICGSPTTAAAGGGQTVVAKASDLVFSGQSGGASTAAGASSVTMSWTGLTSNLVHSAVSINQVGTSFAPTVTTNPTSGTVNSGNTATFTAAATGNPSPTVQWQVSTDGGATFNNVGGATSTTLSFTTSSGQNGNQYRAIFTNAVSSATTTAATLTVTSAVTATQAIASKTLTRNQPSTNFTPVTGSGGTGSLSYSVSPALPTGLLLNAATGAITGTPSVTSTATTYTVTVTDTLAATASNTFSLTVNAAVTATQSVASATLTQSHAATSFTPVTGGGGTAPLTYSVSPTLPTGLSLSTSTGAITGTPSVTSTATTYTVTVTDANSATASNTFSLTVNAAVTATQAIASKTLTQSHAVTSFTPVTGGGGTGSLTYSVSPTLPTGLSLSTSTGAITGTPSVTSTATTYTVTVTDTNSATASNTFSLTVNAAVTATQSVASATLTQNHAATSFTPVTGGGGTGSLTYGVSPALPTGLSLSTSTGAITGTPTVTSTATTYTVTVTDANSATASNTFSLTVNAAVTATQAIASASAVVGQAVTAFTPITGAGGTGSLSYGISPTLPTGLSISSSTGAITGTPSVASSATSYTVTVTDANSATATNSFSLTVTAATPTVTSTPLQTSATAGTSIGDSAVLSGGVSPTGTMTFKLYNNPNGTGSPLDTETTAVTGNGTYNTPTGFTATAAGSYYWVATYGGDANNNSASSSTPAQQVTVNAGAVAHLVVSAPLTANVGTAISVTVTAQDAFNNTVTSYAGTVHFDDNDPSVTLLSNYTFTPVDQGVHIFATVNFTTAGLRIITASDTVSPSVQGASSAITVSASIVGGTHTATFLDTTQADFQAGTPTSVDTATTPGDVILLAGPTADQSNTTVGTSGVGITTTTYGGQTFTPSVSGQLVKASLNLFASGVTGTTPNLTLSVRATSGGLPTGADLASATIPGFSTNTAAVYTATFGTPATLTAGTMYALIIRPVVNPSPGTYALTRSGTSTAGSDVYAGGTRVSGATSGTVWSIPLTGGVSTDAGFTTFMQPSSGTGSGDLISDVKDSNPGAFTTAWTTLSWNATVPGGASVQFQAAASNSNSGPFNFVGPDGTAATFYTTSGGSLGQFSGNRYLKYHAFLSGSTGSLPVLHDVTVVASGQPVVTQNTTAQPITNTTVVITGTGFDPVGTNTVTFNDGAVGTVTTASSTSLTVTFSTQPTAAGSLTAVVTSFGQSSGTPVQVATLTPVITSSTIQFGLNGTTLIINGFGFSTTTNTVVFNDGTVGTVTGATNTQLTVTISTDPTHVGSLTAVVTSNSASSGTPVQVARVVPVPGTVTMTRTPAQQARIGVAAVLAAVNDPDTSDTLTLVSVGTPAHGASRIQAGAVAYAPTGGWTGPDTFTYTVQDSAGDQVSGTINVTVNSTGSTTVNITNITVQSGGTVVLSFFGVPNTVYGIQYTPTLTPANWTNFVDSTTDAFGNGLYKDTTHAGPTGYYRLIYPGF